MSLVRLIKRISELEKENRELRVKLAETLKKCRELEKRLRAYENPHTPPSRRIRKYVKTKTIKPQKKKGAPKGHKGKTRKIPTPHRIVDFRLESCPRCNGKRIKIRKKHKKVTEDIRIIKVVTECRWYECFCEDCNKEFVTSSEELPKKGRFGPNVSALWTILHYIGTIPFDRLSQISKNCFGIDITPAGVHNVIYRTARIFETYFRRIKNRVTKSKYIGSDETKYSYNGCKWWLWNISTEKDVLVLIKNSRGSKVLNNLFGGFINAVINSDCFSAYGKVKAREYQKDWAHILRDVKDLAKHNEEGKQLYKMLSRMHNYIKKAKKKRQENTPKVKVWIRRQKKQINAWLDKNLESKAVYNLILRMLKYEDHWFTCLKYPYVESTNNAREREIRKNVIARKISGLHRSQLGLRSREIMMSTILTLQKRCKNPFEFVLNQIRKYNSNFRKIS